MLGFADSVDDEERDGNQNEVHTARASGFMEFGEREMLCQSLTPRQRAPAHRL